MQPCNRVRSSQTATAGLSRRQVLRLVVAGAGATLVRLPAVSAATAGAAGAAGTHGFLTTEELAILDAATARIIPTDSQPGAHELGVIDYIQSMLSYMPGTDANCDRRVNAADLTAVGLRQHTARPDCPGAGDVNGDGDIDASDQVEAVAAVFQARPVYAGGPFSGRQPQPHFATGSTGCEVCHGAPAQPEPAAAGRAAGTSIDNFPPNAFTEFLPLPRLRALSWRIRILGAAGVPEVAHNPLATGLPDVDLRRQYRAGLASLEALSQQQFGRSFVALAAAQQSQVLDLAAPEFVTLVTGHTIEGMLGAPEYGGNHDRRGWQLIGFDGDSQPLGYTIYDETAPGHYRERPDKPNSGPNPDEDCRGFSQRVNNFLAVISTTTLTQPGRLFSNPYCLDVVP